MTVALGLAVAGLVVIALWLQRATPPGEVGLTGPATTRDEPTTAGGAAALAGAPDCYIGQQRFPCVTSRVPGTQHMSAAHISRYGDSVLLADERLILWLDRQGQEQWRHEIEPAAHSILPAHVDLVDDVVVVIHSRPCCGGPSAVIGLAASTGAAQWRLELEDQVSGATLREDRIIVAGFEVVAAFDRASLDEVWRHEVDPANGGHAFGPYPPAIHGPSGDADHEAPSGTYTCIDVADGSLGPVVGVLDECLAPGDDLGDYPDDQYGDGRSVVRPISAPPWRLDVDEFESDRDERHVTTFLHGGDEYQLRLRQLTDGEETWSRSVTGRPGWWPSAWLTPSLVLLRTEVRLTGSPTRWRLEALDRTDGRHVWTLEEDVSGLAGGTDDRLYLQATRGMTAIDAATGRPLWIWPRGAALVIDQGGEVVVIGHGGVFLIDPPA